MDSRQCNSNHEIMIGNRKMMENNNITVTENANEKLFTLEKEGRTAVLVAIDNSLSNNCHIRYNKRKRQRGDK